MAAETATAPASRAPAAPVAASPEPRTPAKGAAPPSTKQHKAVKPEKGKKGSKQAKGDKGAKADASGSDGPSIAAHPRAARAVERAKSWGGLAGFLLGGYLSLPSNTLADAALRALIAGVVCYVAVWAGAVFVWRRLVILEIKAREQQLMEPHRQPSPADQRRGGPPARPDRPSARTAS